VAPTDPPDSELDPEQRERLERAKARLLNDPEARARIRATAFTVLGSMAEHNRQDVPTDSEKMVDVLIAGFGDKESPARQMAMGRITARMYDLAADHFAPPPQPSRLRRMVRWVRRRLRRE
jgi:hypothetical protein